MRAEPEAFIVCPPGVFNDTSDVARPQKIAIPASSSSALIDIGQTECWITLTSDVDCLLRCGELPVLTDAASGDFPIWSKTIWQFWISSKDRYMKVIGLGSSGSLWFYRSNR